MMPLYVQLPLEDLAQCLNMSALFGYIFTNDTNLIEKVGGGALDGIRLAQTFVCIRIYYYSYSFFLQGYVYIFTRHYGISVIMYYARFASVDM